MKCDRLTPIELECNMCKEIAELKAKNRVLQSFYNLHGNVDNYIDKLKAENESLKQAIKDNGDKAHGLFKDAAEMVDKGSELKAKLAEKDEEIDKQKWRGDEWAKACNQKDKEIESLKASHYAEMVDAGMRERRLKRALWMARAYRAEARKNYWYARSCHEGDERLWSIDGSAVKYIGCIKRTNFDWLKVWSEVESKCLKKAEEYK